MAKGINKVILIGNLGAKPEIHHNQSGSVITNISIATTDTWRDKHTGDQQERTEWHRVVIFNENLAKVVEQYLKKGSKVYIEGQLQTRKWTDQTGQEKYTTEVVLQRYRGELTMLDGREAIGSSGGFSDDQVGRQPRDDSSADVDHAPSGSSFGGRTADLEDDIPF